MRFPDRNEYEYEYEYEYDFVVISRFAPSTTGDAHPGTLLSALLVWLDARARGGQAMLRLEDIDITRVKQVWRDQIVDALAWLGLDWDALSFQLDRMERCQQEARRLVAEGYAYEDEGAIRF
ncbi:MAG TPA: glutamate--tRNA ligase family protein, partial [Kofleriaceae bacterium]